MSDIMTVQGLDLWYGDHQALHDISLNIPEKSITALIGPSGCGKSTFLKTLNRMNDLIPGVKITGDVRYRDQDIFAPGTDVNELRREIGMVFQKPNPFPMSIYDNIAYGPRTHGIKNRARLDEIVEKSLRGAAIWDEVKDRLKKNALGLSGGQQQRLCIARALAVEISPSARISGRALAITAATPARASMARSLSLSPMARVASRGMPSRSARASRAVPLSTPWAVTSTLSGDPCTASTPGRARKRGRAACAISALSKNMQNFSTS